MSDNKKETRDVSGRRKSILVADSQSGTLKTLAASDQNALSKAVPATHNLRQNTVKRTAPRSK